MRDPSGTPIPLNRFGSLQPDVVLVADNQGPRVFTFRDPINDHPMLMFFVGEGEAECGDNVYRYLIVPAERTTAWYLQSRQRTPHTALAQNEGWVMDVDARGLRGAWALGGPATASRVGIDSRPDLELPPADALLPMAVDREHGGWCGPAVPRLVPETAASLPWPPRMSTPDRRAMVNRILGVVDEHAPLANIADRYRVKAVLGVGGFGVVLKAWDRQHRRMVALKVLQPGTDAESQARREGWFDRERRVLQMLSPRLPRRFPAVLSEGRRGGHAYMIAMNVFTGCTVEEANRRLRQAMLPWHPRHICEIIRQTCEALALAHELGVIHRDLKPANLFLRTPVRLPAHMVPMSIDLVLLDFGVARVIGEETYSPGPHGPGTQRYMAPEQILGEDITFAIDIHALGVVLIDLLYGSATDPHTTLPSGGRNPYPGWLIDLIGAMVADAANERPTARQVLAYIDQFVPKTSVLAAQNPAPDGPTAVAAEVCRLVLQAQAAGPQPLLKANEENAVVARVCRCDPVATLVGRSDIAQAVAVLRNQADRLIEQLEAICRTGLEPLAHRYPSVIGSVLERVLQAFGLHSSPPGSGVQVIQFRERVVELRRSFFATLDPLARIMTRLPEIQTAMQSLMSGVQALLDRLESWSSESVEGNPLVPAIHWADEAARELRVRQQRIVFAHWAAAVELAHAAHDCELAGH